MPLPRHNVPSQPAPRKGWHRWLWLEKDLQLGFLRAVFRATPRRSTVPAWPGQRILVVRNDHLGDAILSTGVLAELARRRPDATIDVWARPGPAALLATCPGVRRVIRFEPSVVGVLRGIASVRRERYDVAINLSTRTHGIHNQSLLGLSGATWRVGLWDGARPTSYHVPILRAPHDHIIFDYAQLLDAFGPRPIDAPPLDLRPRLYITRHEAEWAEQQARALGWLGRPVVALNCFSRQRSRDWSVAEAQAVTRQLRRERPDTAVVWLCDAARRHEVTRIVNGLQAEESEAQAGSGSMGARPPRIAVMPAERTVRDLAGLAQYFRVVISPDTGWIHLAAAVGVAVVGLYLGDADHARRWRPWGVFHRQLLEPSEGPLTISANAVMEALRECLAA